MTLFNFKLSISNYINSFSFSNNSLIERWKFGFYSNNSILANKLGLSIKMGKYYDLISGKVQTHRVIGAVPSKPFFKGPSALLIESTDFQGITPSSPTSSPRRMSPAELKDKIEFLLIKDSLSSAMRENRIFESSFFSDDEISKIRELEALDRHNVLKYSLNQIQYLEGSHIIHRQAHINEHPYITLSPNHTYFAIRSPVAHLVNEGVLLKAFIIVSNPIFLGFFLWLYNLYDPGTTMNPYPPLIPLSDIESIREILTGTGDLTSGILESAEITTSELSGPSETREEIVDHRSQKEFLILLAGGLALSIHITLYALSLQVGF